MGWHLTHTHTERESEKLILVEHLAQSQLWLIEFESRIIKKLFMLLIALQKNEKKKNISAFFVVFFVRLSQCFLKWIKKENENFSTPSSALTHFSCFFNLIISKNLCLGCVLLLLSLLRPNFATHAKRPKKKYRKK